ncbi:diguanylate cyclase response regulator [Desulfuromonas versatilis]|uniref:diguanylate cyclase n=1 Tax=Desulfuromonas versatilis TaxID=2802975 RepID=A0ABN6DWT1_9BACT|nr:diguanylate cyclase [Desulfuromonas versatilis]BCR04598.1 diguanylate cyclase response regulator [Desulfuromonas versatilis]
MKKPTILVVDDELFFRRLYAELLSEDGYQVEAVASGDEALARLRRGGVDVVLTDMVMPGLCGLEVLRLARSIDNPPEVILATGHATLETAIQALKNGARDYLIKPFDPEELRHLVRTCVEQRRLLDENLLLKSQIRLFQKGQNLASLIEIDRLLPQAVDTLLHELGGGRGFGFLLAKNKISRLVAADGQNESHSLALAQALLPHLKGLTGPKLLKAGEFVPTAECPPKINSIYLFPLRCEKSLKGALVIFNSPGTDFPDPPPRDNLLFLAEQTALGFENAYRYQGARDLMYADDLTGLYNYRYLQIVLDQEIRRSERYGLEFSLIFVDLDLFKRVNDTHGHLAGSNVLKEVAGLMQQSVREVDIVFRYGGDEFTAMLVETESKGAAVVAERIRRSIENHKFLADAGLNLKLTCTVGYSTFPESASDKRGIVDLADRAMYEGKKQRNVTRGAWEIKGK